MTSDNSKVIASAMQSKTEKFIQKAKLVHGDRYDYSKTKYTISTEKLEITCLKHGVFWQLPSNHLKSKGCKKCADAIRGENKSKLSSNKMIERMRAVHGTRYDYSKMNYIRSHIKVEIICKKHGSFFTLAYIHLKGHHCEKCSREAVRLKYTSKSFIEKANVIHDFKYTYSNLKFTGIQNSVIVTCLKHGDFTISADGHLQGSGCQKCGVEHVAHARRKSIESVLQDFSRVHGDRYIYDKFVYENARKKSIIICREHGDFLQTSYHHLSGRGCPSCANETSYVRSSYVRLCEKYSNGLSNLYVIALQDKDEQFVKIGITKNDVKTRFHGNCKPPYEVSEIFFIKGEAGYIWDLEKKLHRLLRHLKYNPKKSFAGKTECFKKISSEVNKLLTALASDK